MEILIETPNWLGDAVMISPSLSNLQKSFNDANFTFIGSELAIELFSDFPNLKECYSIDKSYIKNIKLLPKIGKFDLFISFRSSFRTTILKNLICADKKIQFNKRIYNSGHQVEKYNQFINQELNLNNDAGKLILHSTASRFKSNKKTIGINPGAAYGSAKRWTKEGFVNVAAKLSKDYEIILFGSTKEVDICNYIEKELIKSGAQNLTNLAGKTSIQELMENIKALDVFLTGDSGPMHIAAAFQIPTVSIFGPTKHLETSQWKNENSVIIKQDLPCQPCMKRSCPLKHHQCMKLIKPNKVIKETLSLLNKV